MGRLSWTFVRLLGALSLLAIGVPGAEAGVTWVELTPYTNQKGSALVRIDDAVIPGRIEFRIEVASPSGGHVSGFFLNVLGTLPHDFAASWIEGCWVTRVELDIKDLGQGNNVNPSPSSRSKGLFDLGVAFAGPGEAVFTIANPGGHLDCFSFGPFAARVERANGAAVKLYGVPVLPVAALRPLRIHSTRIR